MFWTTFWVKWVIFRKFSLFSELFHFGRSKTSINTDETKGENGILKNVTILAKKCTLGALGALGLRPGLGGSGLRAEGSELRAEGRGPRAEGRGLRADGGGLGGEGRGLGAEGGGLRAEGGGLRAGGGGLHRCW